MQGLQHGISLAQKAPLQGQMNAFQGDVISPVPVPRPLEECFHAGQEIVDGFQFAKQHRQV